MPSVRYYNQTAPFWDFVANLEDQGANHPFFGGGNHNNASEDEHDNPSDQEQHRGPSWGSWPFGPMPHRGRHGHPRHHHHGPPPPPPPPGPGDHHPEHPAPPPEYNDEDPPISQPEDGEPGPSHPPHSHGPRGPWGSRHGGHGGRGRGWGGRGRNHCGARGHGGSGVPPFFAGGFPFAANLSPLADLFQSQAHLWGGNNSNVKAEAGNGTGNSFKPEVDVFDTTEAFIVHMSLPGAKKEDVGVDWDAEKSELRVAGVVYRPGDEELIKTLALDERTVGEFERKVRLGSRANPAQVDVEGISAKLEDGILRIEVPKMESGFVEVRKVDIE